MDRGEKKEKIVDIYITAEAVRDIKHKKETKECETTTTQPPEHTGSEMKRSYRTVTVCLVLLCVLLLTAVTVLCVLIYTNNQQFHIKNKQLTEEKNQLLTNYTDLTEERDELTTKYHNITNLHEKLNEEITKLQTYISDGWIYYKFSLYYISSEKRNWTESRRYCRDNGADLIIINNKKEQDFATKISCQETVWIGLSDRDTEATWKWVDGSILDTSNDSYWGGVEPNGNTAQNCVESYLSWWNDHYCYEARKWICEKCVPPNV